MGEGDYIEVRNVLKTGLIRVRVEERLHPFAITVDPMEQLEDDPCMCLLHLQSHFHVKVSWRKGALVDLATRLLAALPEPLWNFGEDFKMDQEFKTTALSLIHAWNAEQKVAIAKSQIEFRLSNSHRDEFIFALRYREKDHAGVLTDEDVLRGDIVELLNDATAEELTAFRSAPSLIEHPLLDSEYESAWARARNERRDIADIGKERLEVANLCLTDDRVMAYMKWRISAYAGA